MTIFLGFIGISVGTQKTARPGLMLAEQRKKRPLAELTAEVTSTVGWFTFLECPGLSRRIWASLRRALTPVCFDSSHECATKLSIAVKGGRSLSEPGQFTPSACGRPLPLAREAKSASVLDSSDCERARVPVHLA